MKHEEAKELLESMLEEDLKSLTPKERTFLYFSQVLEYFVPKRQRESINHNTADLPDEIYND